MHNVPAVACNAVASKVKDNIFLGDDYTGYCATTSHNI